MVKRLSTKVHLDKNCKKLKTNIKLLRSGSGNGLPAEHTILSIEAAVKLSENSSERTSRTSNTCIESTCTV